MIESKTVVFTCLWTGVPLLTLLRRGGKPFFSRLLRNKLKNRNHMVPKQKGVFAGGFVLDKRSADLNLFLYEAYISLLPYGC